MKAGWEEVTLEGGKKPARALKLGGETWINPYNLGRYLGISDYRLKLMVSNGYLPAPRRAAPGKVSDYFNMAEVMRMLEGSNGSV